MNNAANHILIVDAYEHNLQHINVEIPKGKLVVFAGVSGSGKSSLVFDTLAVECHRQWQSNYPLYVQNKMPHYERPKMQSIQGLTPAIVMKQKGVDANSRSTVGSLTDISPLIRLLFSRAGEPSVGGSMAYSPNHLAGMCPHCTGLGKRLAVNEQKLFDTEKSLHEGGIVFSQFSNGWQAYLYQNNPLLDAHKKLRDFNNKEWEILKNGTSSTLKIEIHSNNTGRVDRVDYEGVLPRFYRLYLHRDISKLKQSLQDEIAQLVHHNDCEYCHGTGLNPNALASKINELNIIDLQHLTAEELLIQLQQIRNPVGISIARQIIDRLQRMIDIGIAYLSMNRHTDTLSGGELQRLKIVRNLGNSLSNITYIFDEPTAGLHPADAEKIGNILKQLRDKHNSVLVVEHNPAIIKIADHIIEMGPQAGSHGGQIVFTGTVSELIQQNTPTAQTLQQGIALNQKPLPWNDCFTLQHLTLNNLKNIDVSIPKGVLTAITGVAGSGKSSLMQAFITLFPDTLFIDQKPIGTSIRSTPATYTGVMDIIRKLFGKANHVETSWFSFNGKGACPICKGTGRISYEMAFADPITLPCEECHGHRYSAEALNYRYQGKNIEEVLNLTIEQAYDFFDDKKIRQILQTLIDVGLEYISLGQATSTLSGGETQRLKLASELHKNNHTYVLDEPSTGLHHSDGKKLLS